MSEYEIAITQICLVIIFIFFFIKYMMVSKPTTHGYMSGHEGNQNCIMKFYRGTKVVFYSWGSNDISADGNDSYMGVYCLITSSKKIKGLDAYFDSSEVEKYQDGYIYTLVKKNVYFGSKEMDQFLNQLDPYLNLQCYDQ